MAGTATQLTRFALSGFVVTAFHVLVAASLIHYTSLSPAFANGAAFVAATGFSYVFNALWSFSASLGRGNMFRFLLVSTAGCALAMSVSGAASRFGVPDWAGILMVVAAVPPVTFVLHKTWTFRCAGRR
jgi:putative flippase GtrA